MFIYVLETLFIVIVEWFLAWVTFYQEHMSIVYRIICWSVNLYTRIVNRDSMSVSKGVRSHT